MVWRFMYYFIPSSDQELQCETIDRLMQAVIQEVRFVMTFFQFQNQNSWMVSYLADGQTIWTQSILVNPWGFLIQKILIPL